MNALLILILLVLVILAILLIKSAAKDNDFSVEQEIIIEKPKKEVFDFIKLLKNQDRYNKWLMADPKIRRDYTGVDGTVGFISFWESNSTQVGKGEQEILRIEDDSVVEIEIRFIRPFISTARSIITAVLVGNDRTKVIWIFRSTLNFRMKIFHTIMNAKKVLGRDLNTSLQNLKLILER